MRLSFPSRRADLLNCATTLIFKALNPKTKNFYNRILKTYKIFLVSMSRTWHCPYPVTDLLAFITHLHQKGLASATIKSYLSALSYFNKLYGGNDTTKAFAIQQLLVGISNIPSHSVRRLPLFPSDLQTLISALSVSDCSPYKCALFAAMLSIGFALALRIGEMTNSCHNLIFKDISCSNSTLVVTFSSYKHCKPSYPMVHVLKRSSDPVCPIPFLLHYLKLRGDSPGPLFLFKKAAVSRKFFSDVFKHLISVAGLKGFYSPHSLRIGAASWWAHKGASDSQIRQRGRWNSDAFKQYIRGTIVHF